MKDELNSKLVEILTAIQTATGQAKDFALAQLPDVAQTYVAYGRAMTTTGVVAAVLWLVIVITVALRYHVKHSPSKPYYDGFGVFMGALICGGPAAITLFVIVPRMLMVWFAPKVWLLHEIARMVRT